MYIIYVYPTVFFLLISSFDSISVVPTNHYRVLENANELILLFNLEYEWNGISVLDSFKSDGDFIHVYDYYLNTFLLLILFMFGRT